MELAGSFRASSGADAGLPDGAGGSPPPAQAVRATASRQASPVMDVWFTAVFLLRAVMPS